MKKQLLFLAVTATMISTVQAGWLDDLKSVISTGKEVANVGKDVYNTVTGSNNNQNQQQSNQQQQNSQYQQANNNGGIDPNRVYVAPVVRASNANSNNDYVYPMQNQNL